MDPTELAFAGIARQAELLREHTVSSTELVELYLERIASINPRLNAFVEVRAEQARAAAAAADERLGQGDGAEAPLLGVPVAFKDEVDIEDRRAQHGTCAYSGPASPDAEHWRRLKAAGAVLLGATTLPELAICGFTESEAWGETRNPWNPTHSPGGSSGGSAAAVAAGLVGAASASDGAGSIRIPAGNCGLFGLKPQRGRISLAPLPDHWLGLTSSGCLTRRVRDTALWLDVAAGPHPVDSDSPPAPEVTYTEAASREPGRLRVAFSLKAPLLLAPPLLDPAVEAAVEGVAAALEGLGHAVERRDPAWGLVGNDLVNVYLKGIEDDFETVDHPDRLEPRTRGFRRLARAVPGPLLRRSLRRRQGHAERLNRIFEHCDLLVLPWAGIPAIEVGRWAGAGALRTLVGMGRVYPYTAAWNYTGQPAAAVPAGFSPGGLPLAVQLVVPPNREDLLLSVGAQLEQALGWPDHRPSLAA